MELPKILEELPTLLQQARIVIDEEHTLFHKLVIAAARCIKAFEFLEYCKKAKLVPLLGTPLNPEAPEPPQPPQDALNIAKNVMDNVTKQLDQKEKEITIVELDSSTIEELNRSVIKVAEFVCEHNEWLNELDQPQNPDDLDSALVKVPEVKLWWIGSFGKERKHQRRKSMILSKVPKIDDEQEKSVTWEKFWRHFSKYMCEVYGYFLMTDDGEADGDAEDFANAVQSCLGKVDYDESTKVWTCRKDSIISIEDFKKFYQRCGPWGDLFSKTLPLCTEDGMPLDIFCPTENAGTAKKYLRSIRNENKKQTFVVRFSKNPGCFVHQTAANKILITNSPSGYSLETLNDGTHSGMTDIDDVLTRSFEKQDEDRNVGRQKALKKRNRKCDQYMKLRIKEEEVKNQDLQQLVEKQHTEVMGKLNAADEQKVEQHEEVMGNLKAADKRSTKQHTEVVENLRDIKDTVIQLGMKALRDEAMVPRVFYICPEDYEDLARIQNKKQLRKEKWRLHILCEGDETVGTDEKRYYNCHETDEKDGGYPIDIPSEKFLEYLPLLRYGCKFLNFTIRALSCDAIPGGTFIAAFNEGLRLGERLEKCDKEFDRLNKIFFDTEELKDEDIQNSHKKLMELLEKSQLEHLLSEVQDGKCGSLELMFNEKEKAPFWVCENHRKGLVALDGQKRINYLKKPKIQRQVGVVVPSVNLSGAASPSPTAAGPGTPPASCTPGFGTVMDSTLRVICVKAKSLIDVERNAIRKKDVSDPYVVITPIDVRGDKIIHKVTTRKNNNLNPVWDEEYIWTHANYLIDKVEFVIWDHNKVTSDTFIGRCEAKIDDDDAIKELDLSSDVHRDHYIGTLFVKIKYTVP